MAKAKLSFADKLFYLTIIENEKTALRILQTKGKLTGERKAEIENTIKFASDLLRSDANLK